MKSKNNIVCVIGTRPEAIKMARALNPCDDGNAASRFVRALADETTNRVRSAVSPFLTNHKNAYVFRS